MSDLGTNLSTTRSASSARGPSRGPSAGNSLRAPQADSHAYTPGRTPRRLHTPTCVGPRRRPGTRSPPSRDRCGGSPSSAGTGNGPSHAAGPAFRRSVRNGSRASGAGLGIASSLFHFLPQDSEGKVTNEIVSEAARRENAAARLRSVPPDTPKAGLRTGVSLTNATVHQPGSSA
jgi:hypothetical protein